MEHLCSYQPIFPTPALDINRLNKIHISKKEISFLKKKLLNKYSNIGGELSLGPWKNPMSSWYDFKNMDNVNSVLGKWGEDVSWFVRLRGRKGIERAWETHLYFSQSLPAGWHGPPSILDFIGGKWNLTLQKVASPLGSIMETKDPIDLSWSRHQH